MLYCTVVQCNSCLILQRVQVARGARTVFVTATVVTATQSATRQQVVPSVRPVSRVRIVTKTSMSAQSTSRVETMRNVLTPSAPLSVSAAPASRNTMPRLVTVWNSSDTNALYMKPLL